MHTAYNAVSGQLYVVFLLSTIFQLANLSTSQPKDWQTKSEIRQVELKTVNADVKLCHTKY